MLAERDQRGIVAVWMALMLVLLLGISAFAVDVTLWHMAQSREQRAADAAALAGAVKFPGDAATASAMAVDIATKNGYDFSQATAFDPDGGCSLGLRATRMCVGPGSRPYQYKVKIVRNVSNIFGGILGMSHTPVGATATAEYLKPLAMGSPSNQFGNDPDAITSWPVGSDPPPQSYPNFWANIAGGRSVKQNGDAYAANYCDILTDGCDGLGSGLNVDYKSNGYFYEVDFTRSATVDLQAFDPAFVEVGDSCTDANAHLLDASRLTNIPGYPQGPGGADIRTRFAPVTNASNQSDPGFQYCTGDQIFQRAGTTAGPAPSTTYTVLKATVPGDPSSATPACPPITFPGFVGDVATALRNGVTQAGAPSPLVKYFRQWTTLCSVTGQAGDAYFIEVSTDAASQGHNRFALRADDGGGGAPVNVSGNGYMGMYANVGTHRSQFYLTRIPSAAAGHTLKLNFFDIGDAATGSLGTLTIEPPPDSNVGASFQNCTWSGGIGAVGFRKDSLTAPWGPPNPLTDCVITNVNNVHDNWNGQWSTVSIPIPVDYTCDDADANGCWIKINYQFTGGINDTTSWNAFLVGDPVRLVG